MAVSRPHYGVCIVVDDDCDVFIAFAVTGLVYAYVDKPIKASGQTRLEILQATADAFADSLLVYAHVLRDSAPWKIFCEP